jgi:hypothetical protein
MHGFNIALKIINNILKCCMRVFLLYKEGEEEKAEAAARMRIYGGRREKNF